MKYFPAVAPLLYTPALYTQTLDSEQARKLVRCLKVLALCPSSSSTSPVSVSATPIPLHFEIVHIKLCCTVVLVSPVSKKPI